MNALGRLAELGTFEGRGSKRGYLVAATTAAVYTAAQVAIPLIMGSIIDEALAAEDSRGLLLRVLLLVGVASTSSVVNGVQKTTFTWLGERWRGNLQAAILARLFRLPLAFFDRRKSGELLSLLLEDAVTAARGCRQMLSEVTLSMLQLGFILAVVIVEYGAVVLAALALIPIYTLIPVLFGRPTRTASRAVSTATADASTAAQESLQAVRELRLFDRERWAVDRLRRLLREDVSRRVKLKVLASIYSLTDAMYFLVVALVFWFGGLQVIAGQLTVGKLVALVGLLAYLESPVSRLVRLNTEHQRVRAAVERISEALAEEPELGTGGELTLGSGAHEIRFEEVSFAYTGSSEPALEDVSFTVDPGRTLAIVGPSGSGKSTLVALLAGLYEPSSGCISIDGRPLASYDLASLRRQIGFVLQEAMLFAGTVRENILIGRLDADDDAMTAAARAANAHEFIRALPAGYDTQIGERGVQLSGGQRQRIGLARVLLRDPSILVLDEATSALDLESERLVRDAVGRLMAGRTSLLVSHRPSSFVDADEILVIDAGRVVDRGRHEELVVRCGTYSRMVGERRAEPVAAS